MTDSVPPRTPDLRVLHCIPDMAGGGAERQLALLAEAQVRRGLDVHVALTRGGPNLDRLEAAGAVVHTLATSGSHDPRLVVRLARLAHRHRPDLLQTWLPQMDVAGGLAALLTRTPWVIAERSSAPAYVGRWKHRWLRPAIARRADGVVANSRVGRAYWAERLPRRVLLATAPNALPLGEIAAATPAHPTELGLDPELRIVLFVGRLAPEKNLPFLLQVMREVIRESNAGLLVCGVGPERPAIETHIRTLGLGDRVRMLGYRSDVWRLMKYAGVVVNPSRFEGQPNAVLEAMACGTPLVVSDIPAHREFLSPERAALLSPGAHDSWVGAIGEALRASPVVCARIAASLAAAEQFSASAAAEIYKAAYREVLIRRAEPAGRLPHHGRGH